MNGNNNPVLRWTITNRNFLKMRIGSIVMVRHARLGSWNGVVEQINWNNSYVLVFYHDWDRRSHWEHVNRVEMVIVF